MAIEDWMPTLKAKIAEISGIVQVHDYTDLPGSLQAFPTAIILTESGEILYSGPGPKIEYHDIQITIYTAGQILPEGLSQAVPFITRVRDKLAGNVQLNGKVNYIDTRPEEKWYEGPGQVDYAGKNHTGIIFRYRVKEDVTGDFTVSA